MKEKPPTPQIAFKVFSPHGLPILFTIWCNSNTTPRAWRVLHLFPESWRVRMDMVFTGKETKWNNGEDEETQVAAFQYQNGHTEQSEVEEFLIRVQAILAKFGFSPEACEEIKMKITLSCAEITARGHEWNSKNATKK